MEVFTTKTLLVVSPRCLAAMHGGGEMLHDFAVLLSILSFRFRSVTLIAWRGSRYVDVVSRRWHGSDCVLACGSRWSIGFSRCVSHWFVATPLITPG